MKTFLFNLPESQCLCLSSLLWQHNKTQVVYKQQKSDSLNTGAWEVQDQCVGRFNVLWWRPASWSTENGFSCVLTWERPREREPSRWILVSFTDALQSYSFCFPKSLPPNNCTLGIRFQHRNLGAT